MLINTQDYKNTNVKFISYTGKYPNLCRGILTLEIDGKIYKFGHIYNMDLSLQTAGDFDKFWSSGGEPGNYQNEWDIDVSLLPEQFRKYAAEIDEVFNENVDYGCCGGCC